MDVTPWESVGMLILGMQKCVTIVDLLEKIKVQPIILSSKVVNRMLPRSVTEVCRPCYLYAASDNPRYIPCERERLFPWTYHTGWYDVTAQIYHLFFKMFLVKTFCLACISEVQGLSLLLRFFPITSKGSRHEQLGAGLLPNLILCQATTIYSWEQPFALLFKEAPSRQYHPQDWKEAA